MEVPGTCIMLLYNVTNVKMSIKIVRHNQITSSIKCDSKTSNIVSGTLRFT